MILGATASAQVTVTATAGTDLSSRARGGSIEVEDTVPAGTAPGENFGPSASANDPVFGPRSDAAAMLQVRTTPAWIRIDVSESADGGFGFLGQGSAGFGEHIWRFRLAATPAMPTSSQTGTVQRKHTLLTLAV